MTKEKIKKVECHRCKEDIDLDQDLHISLGTHQGRVVTEMVYFHFNCWKLHFEEKAREKAKAVVDGMQERMMPIAKQLKSKIEDALEKSGGGIAISN